MKLVHRLKLRKEYLEKLLNKKIMKDNTIKLKQNIGTVKEITVEKVRKAMSKPKISTRAKWCTN